MNILIPFIEPIAPTLFWDSIAAQSIPSWTSFARASNAWSFNSSGVLTQSSSNVARYDYNPSTLAALGLLLEGARTNGIRNNTMVGAVAGTPGTKPNRWNFGSISGLSSSIPNVNAVNGMNYIEVRVSGTTSSGGTFPIEFEPSNGISAANGQFWANSLYVSVVAGSTANIDDLYISTNMADSGASYLGNLKTTIAPNATLTRYTSIQTLNNASTAFVYPGINIQVNSAGKAIDITLRIAIPQIEHLSSTSQTASSPILTTSAAVTRAADILTLTGAAQTILASAQGTVLFEVMESSNDTTGPYILRASGSGYEIYPSNTNSYPSTYNGTTILSTASAPTWTNSNRVALSWNGSGRTVIATGITPSTDSNIKAVSTAPSYVGSNGGNNAFFGWFPKTAIWSNRVTNSDLLNKVILNNPL